MATGEVLFRDLFYEETGMTFSLDSFLNRDRLEVEKHFLQLEEQRNTGDQFLGKRYGYEDEEDDYWLQESQREPEYNPWSWRREQEPIVLEVVEKPEIQFNSDKYPTRSEALMDYIKISKEDLKRRLEKLNEGYLTPVKSPPSPKPEATPEPEPEPEPELGKYPSYLNKVQIRQWKMFDKLGKSLEEQGYLNGKKNINRNKLIQKKLADNARAEQRKAAKKVAKQPTVNDQEDVDYSELSEEEAVEQEVQTKPLNSLQRINLARRLFYPTTKQLMHKLPSNMSKVGMRPIFQIEYSADCKEPIPHPTQRKWIYHRSPGSSAVFDRLCLELVLKIIKAKMVDHVQINYCRGCHAFISGPASKLGKLHDFNPRFCEYFNLNAVNYRVCSRKVQANLDQDPDYYEKLDVSLDFPERSVNYRLPAFATSSFRYELKMLDQMEVHDELVENMKSFLRDAGDWQRYEYSGNKLETREMMPVPWYCIINNSLPLKSGLVDRCIYTGEFSSEEKQKMLIEDERAKREKE